MDMRLAGEILLRYHDRLVREQLATPLPTPPRTRTPYDLRLKRRRPLDALLTHFGLSPHPRLVLIVEGATERLLLPRVMRKLELRTDDEFISVQDAEGVRTNLGPLLAYLAPQPGEIESDRYVRPLRPLTRFLIVFDPEGPVATEEEREERRQVWVERVMRALPQQMQTNVVREQMDQLVAIRTWNRKGESFEFAHFTDRELARAIDNLDQRPQKPPHDELIKLVARARSERWNLKSLLHGSGKVDLADELWPVLERKLERALGRKTETRIAAVPIIDEATRLAQQFARGNTVIALQPTP
jgi:predicted ATP-dependent endonuclease of OLD family